MLKENKQKQQQKANNPFPEMEQEVLNFWDKAKIFRKSVEKKAPEGNYVFYDGPPFATGMPHYGHIVASIMKDAVPRYWTMKGYRIERRWGWDCHGLPVENLAEKELKLKDKTDIEKIGIAKFNKYCQSIVMRYAKEWRKIVERIGRWIDMDNDYRTMDPDYMESIWWVFKSLYDKGLIYQGHKAMHICPRCGTTLSNFEVTQNYKDITDISVTVKFELEDPTNLQTPYKFTNKDKVYILAWTTTPWTLIGNVALAVGKNINYEIVSLAKSDSIKELGDYEKPPAISTQKDYYIIAKDRKDLLLGEHSPETINTIRGKNLVGLKYKPLFDYYFGDEKLENRENGWKVYAANFVSTEEGTGVVHIAPAFGEEDMELGKKKNLPFIQQVDDSGRLKNEVKDWPGQEVKPIDDPKKTDKKIVEWLKKNNVLFDVQEYEHSYPHCWRCETPLLNYATESWFVEVTKIKDNLIKNNQKIHWTPAHVKDGRFGKWLEEARDWAISRSRYWGAPLPVWVCNKCGEKTVVSSRKELEKLSGKKVNDLHKQFVDKITWPCSKCKGTMKRIPEVLDCWFESGSMPYAQNHYLGKPLKNFNPEKGKNFPADFIAEGIDQTRGWFYTLMVLSTALFNKEVAQNIIANGIVLAEDGEKMSKRLNNYPAPVELFEKYSVDAMRYYLLSSPVLVAENLNFSEDGVKEALRKVEILLWNVYKFYTMYANELKVKSEKSKVKSDNILDKWILARLNQLIDETTKHMDNYVIPKAIRPIEEFINDLSTWYLRRSRDRFKTGNKQDKRAALQTTGYVLLQLSKVMAPFMPFVAEQIWQRVTKDDFKDENKSVHLEEWPSADKLSTTDKDILSHMKTCRKIIEIGLAARDEAKIKVRQPLSLLLHNALGEFQMTGESEGSAKVFSSYLELNKLIKDEINVKEVRRVTKEKLPKGPDYITKQDGDIIVVVDTKLTPKLKQEGIKRELVRFINNLRKEDGLTIQAIVTVGWESKSEEIKGVIVKCKNEIAKATLAKKIKEGLNGEVDIKKEVKINGQSIVLGIMKK